jgi:hypothetical protein
MNTAPKRGSSRRKGDEFQDLTALRVALELYGAGKEFQIFIEYEHATSIDDIVVVLRDGIQAIQAKYAVDPWAVYKSSDFLQKDSRVFFGRLADGWRKLREARPTSRLQVVLLSNRGRDSSLEGIVGSDGRFVQNFIDDKARKAAKAFRGV